MNHFFTLLLAASCLTAVGQSDVCNYPILQVPQIVFLEENGVWLSASSDDPLIWNVDVIADSILATTCGVYQVQELVDFGFGLVNPCALISSIYVVSETCPLAPSSFCGEGTVWEVASSTCIVANPADINFDGCVQLNDLLDLLSAYGDCGAEESAWQCGDPIEYQGYDYETVQIGEQCWFAENLRNENYANGADIPSSLSDNQWSSTTQGAVAIYGEGNSECNASVSIGDACDDVFSLHEYGRLYNWHAVNDSRGLCPVGWHVPSDEDWMTLEISLGMSESEASNTGFRGTNQATQMKRDSGWSEVGGNFNGTNSSGFAGLPGGGRPVNNLYWPDSGFYWHGVEATWWTSTSGTNQALQRNIYYANPQVARGFMDKKSGLSVRCVQDFE